MAQPVRRWCAVVVTRYLPSARTLCYLGAVLLLVALGVISLVYSGRTQQPATPVAAHAAATTSAPSTTLASPNSPAPAATSSVSTAPAANPSTSSSPAAVVDGTQDAAALQRSLDRTSTPDLPAATSAELVRLARAELTAQLTAAGTSNGLQIQAAIARRADGRADLAAVTLLYSITDPAALEPEYRVVLTFALSSAGWVPVVDQTAGTPNPED